MLHLLAGLMFGTAFCLALAVTVGMIAGEWRRIAAILSGAELAAAGAETRRIRASLRARRRGALRMPGRPAPLRAAA